MTTQPHPLPPDNDLVTVGPGIPVPRHQAGQVRLEELDITAMLRVELDDDGRVWIRSVTFGEKVDPHQIPRIDFEAAGARMVFDDVRVKLLNSTENADPAEWLQRWADVDTAEKRTRRRAGLTSAQLRQVADAHTEGGAALVAERLHVGTRHAYRYVTEARKAGLL